jgi:hypothetical protein
VPALTLPTTLQAYTCSYCELYLLLLGGVERTTGNADGETKNVCTLEHRFKMIVGVYQKITFLLIVALTCMLATSAGTEVHVEEGTSGTIITDAN